MGKIESALQNGETYLGIEFGSTRIKAVLIDKEHKVISTSSHNWENRLEDGVWTYTLDDIWTGIQDCYGKLASNIKDTYGMDLTNVGAVGISAMMHGYMAFDEAGNLLVPFRTWRNTMTGQASEELTELFGFNVPQRWSVAHLYQAILRNEPHVNKISFFTTLAGYIHWKLTGEKVLGIGDASGMFPIDDATRKYDARMLKQFNGLIASKNIKWNVEDILPGILSAGEAAGKITEEGSKLLDVKGILKSGIPMCPPEGDAGTGMVATNAVMQRTGNISAGTSIFSMVVLEKPLSKVYPEIDMVTTPSGDAVAMVHCNNCLGDIDSWVKLLGDAASLLGAEFDMNTLYAKLYNLALESDPACKGLLSYNYISGEHVTGFSEGRPMFTRLPDADIDLGSFIRTHLYSACASLKIGMKILVEKEGVEVDALTGHGGFFKQAYVGQRIMTAAMNAPVTVMETAGEGGPWGMAILAAYMKNNSGDGLAEYLSNRVFAGFESTTVQPEADEVKGFNKFMDRYIAGLSAERAVVENFDGTN